MQHTGIYILARGVPGIINFLTIVIYTRLLATSDYGRYSLVIAFVGLANGAFFQWLRSGLLRFFAVNQNHTEAFISEVVKCFCFVMIITASAGVILSPFIWNNPVWRGLIFLGLFLLWVQAWFDLNLELARAKLRPFRYGLIYLAKSVISLGFGTLLVVQGLGAYGALLGLSAGLFLPTALFGRHKWFHKALLKPDQTIKTRLFRYGLPMSVTVVLMTLVQYSDRYLLAVFEGDSAVGLYAAGYDLAQQSLGVIMAITALAGFPLAVTALEEKGPEAARAELRKYVFSFFMIAMPATTGIMVLAPNIALVLLGEAFSEAGRQIIPFVSLAVLIAGFKSFYLDYGFQLGGRTSGLAWVALGAALTNIGLNLWWIPLFGLLGAAYATLVAYTMGMLLSLFYGRKFFALPGLPFGSFRIFLASLMMAGILWPTRYYIGPRVLIGQITLGVLVYAIFILSFNVGNTRKWFFRFFRRT